MKRLKTYATSLLIIALLVLPSTTSSQQQEHPPEFSPLKTSRPEPQQGPLTPSTKFVKVKRPVPNQYLVVLNDDVVPDNAPIEVRRERITEIANSHAKTHGGRIFYIYETALKGYAIELPNEAAAIAISRSPRVKWVEEDAFAELDQAPASPQPSPPWGLDAIDGTMPAPAPSPIPVAPFTSGRTNGFYFFGANGAGVSAYLLDSGINIAHEDFLMPSRAFQVANCWHFMNCVSGMTTGFENFQACVYPMPNSTNNDCYGHGTAVASILGGNQYGVAKGVTLKSVKTASTNGTFATATVAGMNWVTGDHQANPSIPAVVVLTAGFAIGSTGIEVATANALAAGITVVKSSGNDGADASFSAPANVVDTLVVGAVDWNGVRPGWSNWGVLLDIFAPGVSIPFALTGNFIGCAWDGTDNKFCVNSGTSLAAPHVAGEVAMYLQGRPGTTNCGPNPIQGVAPAFGNVSSCPDRVARFIKANSNLNKLSNLNPVSGAPSGNRFVWTAALPAPANPVDNQRFFVWQHYHDFLERFEPDEDGLNHWTNNITGPCGTGFNVNNACTREWRIHTSRAFWVYKFPALFNAQGGTTNNAEFVHKAYEIYLRRSVPDSDSGFQHWLNDLTSQYGNPASYEGVTHIIDAFIISPEYRRRFGPP